MHDGPPTTPAEIAAARTLLAETRRELGLLVGAGVTTLVPSFASTVMSEAQLGAGATTGDVSIAAIEQPGGDLLFVTASRGGVPFAAITMAPDEALRVAMQISEILNRRSASRR